MFKVVLAGTAVFLSLMPPERQHYRGVRLFYRGFKEHFIVRHITNGLACPSPPNTSAPCTGMN